MTRQVVVNVEPCELLASHSDEVIGDCGWVHPLDRCAGCRNNETRAVLDTAIEVELVDLDVDWDGNTEFIPYEDPDPAPGDLFRVVPSPTREDNDQ